ncbi:MAG: energy-coupled thiamine transporter ThiT [Bacilli bacterium]
MEKENKVFSTRGMTEIAILTAVAFALDMLQSGIWRGVFTNGGSIGIAMLPILILCYRRGFLSGLVSGFILSFLQMFGGVYSIASSWYQVAAQIGLDYILAYPCVAIAGLFFKPYHQAETKGKKIAYLLIGTGVGGFLKFMCHFLAGILFWQNYDFPGGPAVYSLVYNGGYMLPNIIICGAILVIIALKQPSLLVVKKIESNEQEESKGGDLQDAK